MDEPVEVTGIAVERQELLVLQFLLGRRSLANHERLALGNP